MVTLTGYMGSGKSTVGRILAGMLDVPFIDLDDYIEHKTGQSIPEMLADGEDRFRAIEAEALRDVVIMREIQDEDAVIALGGGTIAINAVQHLILGHTVSVYLRTSFETARRRVAESAGSRPLFSEDLYMERLPYYEKARFAVDTDDRTPEQVAEEIKGILEKMS